MISPFAVDEYLTRKTRDSAKYKQMSDKLVDKLFNKYVGKVHVKAKLRRDQKVAALLGCKYDRYLYLLDMGLGKTVTTLATIAAKRPKRVLVCVPSIANIGGWIDEVKKQAPYMAVAGVLGTPKQRQKAFWGNSKIIVVTYMGLLSFCCTRVVIGKGKNGKPKTKLKVDKAKIRRVAERFSFMVADECTKACEISSSTFKVLSRLSPLMKNVFGLTGTLFGRDATDIWAQFYVVDLGETFGKTLGMFREAFFRKEPRVFGGFNYILRKRRKAILMKWLRNRSIRYETKECLDLPPVSYQVIKCDLPAGAERLYETVAKELQQSAKNHVLAEASFLRMRQLTSGFVTLKGREKQEDKIEIRLKQNPKMDELLALVEGIPKDSKVLIFHQFKTTGKMIEDALAKAQHKCLRLFSGTARKDEVVRKFDAAKDIRFLVGSETAAYGLNIQSANYVIFFESPLDSRVRSQMEKRAHRVGQTKHVFFYDIVCRNTVDERIIEYNREGKNLLRDIVDGKVAI